MSAHLTGADLDAYEREWKVKGHNINRSLVPAQRAKPRSDAAFYFDEAVRGLKRIEELEAQVATLNAKLVYEQDRVEQQNEEGGEARKVVMDIAHLLDVKLTDTPRSGQTWSPENMGRATDAVKGMRLENAQLRAKLRVIREAAQA